MDPGMERSNRKYDYFGNLLKYQYDYFAFWANIP